jgi:hypothetical protein
MQRVCCSCDRTGGLYLWHGRLYCVFCLPVDTMPPWIAAGVLRDRSQATREAIQEARERR